MDRRTRRLVAAVVGVGVGVTLAVILLFTVALRAAHDAHSAVEGVKASRVEATRRTCEEANDRHTTAKAGIERLVKETTPHNHTLADAATRHRLLEAFVEALDPHYDCALRVRELTK